MALDIVSYHIPEGVVQVDNLVQYKFIVSKILHQNVLEPSQSHSDASAIHNEDADSSSENLLGSAGLLTLSLIPWYMSQQKLSATRLRMHKQPRWKRWDSGQSLKCKCKTSNDFNTSTPPSLLAKDTNPFQCELVTNFRRIISSVQFPSDFCQGSQHSEKHHFEATPERNASAGPQALDTSSVQTLRHFQVPGGCKMHFPKRTWVFADTSSQSAS